MQVQPYLFFYDGRCSEAIDFYRDKLGAEVTMVMRYKDNPEPPSAEQCGSGMPMPADMGERVMHSHMKIGASEVMASDAPPQPGAQPGFKGFGLSLAEPDEAKARKLFDALADGGQVQMPMGKTFFSPAFGMVADRFGVQWMVMVPQAM